jgi:hypothetical protein
VISRRDVRSNTKTPIGAADAVFGAVAGTALELLAVAMVLLGIRRRGHAGSERETLRPAPMPNLVYYMAGLTLMFVGFIAFGLSG